ncbi:hypothetical protein FB45DRAFT_872777 [Roridomyces roridus]|uniref:Uncharacterized protein n=1 Tax=Roridomyces roridus TaxID=1738132 RepID=A0AAD7FDE7_9AGAR|nr:hypothetical protein FB45DRAFT_872777 [Roridomyces roridus]
MAPFPTGHRVRDVKSPQLGKAIRGHRLAQIHVSVEQTRRTAIYESPIVTSLFTRFSPKLGFGGTRISIWHLFAPVLTSRTSSRKYFFVHFRVVRMYLRVDLSLSTFLIRTAARPTRKRIGRDDLRGRKDPLRGYAVDSEDETSKEMSFRPYHASSLERTKWIRVASYCEFKMPMISREIGVNYVTQSNSVRKSTGSTDSVSSLPSDSMASRYIFKGAGTWYLRSSAPLRHSRTRAAAVTVTMGHHRCLVVGYTLAAAAGVGARKIYLTITDNRSGLEVHGVVICGEFGAATWQEIPGRTKSACWLGVTQFGTGNHLGGLGNTASCNDITLIGIVSGPYAGVGTVALTLSPFAVSARGQGVSPYEIYESNFDRIAPLALVVVLTHLFADYENATNVNGLLPGYRAAFVEAVGVLSENERRRTRWATTIFLGQTALLVFTWGFFGIVQQRGSIPLSFDNALWVEMHPRPVTLLVTLVSTALANISTFLFACGLRYAVTLHLYGRGMLLSKFTSAVALSSRSPINDTRRWKWALASGFVIFLTGVQLSARLQLDVSSISQAPTLQTSGELDFCIVNSSSEHNPQWKVGEMAWDYMVWSPPLSPLPPTCAAEGELNTSLPTLSESSVPSLSTDGVAFLGLPVFEHRSRLLTDRVKVPVRVSLCIPAPSPTNFASLQEVHERAAMQPAFGVGLTESGFALLKFDDGLNSSLTMMDQTFTAETWGVLPMTVVALNSTVWFPNSTLIPGGFQVKSLLDLPDGLDATYNMTQQGFTVAIDCEFQDPDTTSSSATLIKDSVADWDSGNQNGNIKFSQLSANCDVPIIGSSTAYTLGDQANYVLMVGCAQDNNYTLTFRSSGKYDFLKPVSCTIAPLILSVTVNYTDVDPFDATINTAPSQSNVQPFQENSLGPAGLAAIFALQQTMSSAQEISNNVMGDELNSFLQDFDESNQFDDNDILGTLEDYIAAVAEYSSTVMRACISAKGQVFPNGIPDNLATNSSGFFLIRTFGWQHTSDATFAALIPGTLIALFSILVVLSTAVNYWSVAYTRFNPADPLQLMAASAAGGLDGIFHGGLKEGNLEARVDVPIFLQSIPGRGPVMVTQENLNYFT